MRRSNERFFAEVLLRAEKEKIRRAKRIRGLSAAIPAAAAAVCLLAVLPGVSFRAGKEAPPEERPAESESAASYADPTGAGAPQQSEIAVSVRTGSGETRSAGNAAAAYSILNGIRAAEEARSVIGENQPPEDGIRVTVTADGETTHWVLAAPDTLFCEETRTVYRTDAETFSRLTAALG